MTGCANGHSKVAVRSGDSPLSTVWTVPGPGDSTSSTVPVVGALASTTTSSTAVAAPTATASGQPQCEKDATARPPGTSLLGVVKADGVYELAADGTSSVK